MGSVLTDDNQLHNLEIDRMGILHGLMSWGYIIYYFIRYIRF